jgi:hypothetical protein
VGLAPYDGGPTDPMDSRKVVVTAAPEVLELDTPCVREWPAWAVPAAAVGEWVDLQLAIAGAGRAPVCRHDPEVWWSAGASVEVAVVACSWCPVLGECRGYALAAGERYGVWGGTTPAERRAER